MSAKYIGGDRLSLGERQAKYRTKLDLAPVVRSGDWRDQCYCGSTVVVSYRSRHYCRRCGHLVSLCAPHRFSVRKQNVRRAESPKV